MKVIISNRADGGVDKTEPNPRSRATVINSEGAWEAKRHPELIYPGRETEETEAEFLTRVELGGQAVGALKPDVGSKKSNHVSSFVMDATAMPGKTFRQAWVVVAGKLEVDMPKARIIHMDRIREARNRALFDADIEVEAALDAGDRAAEIAARVDRVRLRDIPQDFDLSGAATPEELKGLWPAELPAASGVDR